MVPTVTSSEFSRCVSCVHFNETGIVSESDQSAKLKLSTRLQICKYLAVKDYSVTSQTVPRFFKTVLAIGLSFWFDKSFQVGKVLS